MKLPNDLGQIEHLVKETSTNIESLKHHIRGLEEHIAIHKNLEQQFKQNLSVLKDVNIISIASEFKKVKEELATVSSRIVTSSIDLSNSFVFLERAENLLIELNSKRDMILESQKSKVLTGNFGKR